MNVLDASSSVFALDLPTACSIMNRPRDDTLQVSYPFLSFPAAACHSGSSFVVSRLQPDDASDMRGP